MVRERKCRIVERMKNRMKERMKNRMKERMKNRMKERMKNRMKNRMKEREYVLDIDSFPSKWKEILQHFPYMSDPIKSKIWEHSMLRHLTFKKSIYRKIKRQKWNNKLCEIKISLNDLYDERISN